MQSLAHVDRNVTTASTTPPPSHRSAGRSSAPRALPGATAAPTRRDVEAAIRRLSAVQLDSISTVDRAHRLTLASRIGAFDPEDVPKLLRAGRIFEYWAHEASLLPIELWPHFRTRDGGARPLGLARPRLPRPPGAVRTGARADPRRGAARLARLRGERRRRRHVELEAREDGARSALGQRPARDRRPAQLPAALRPHRARDPEARPRRADAARGRDAAHVRAACRRVRAAR